MRIEPTNNQSKVVIKHCTINLNEGETASDLFADSESFGQFVVEDCTFVGTHDMWADR
jgi:hypothetical protein